MNNIKIQFSIEDILKLVRQLPIEVKAMLIEEWKKEQKAPSQQAPMSLTFKNFEAFNQPINLNDYAIKKESLEPLVELWKDELPANELCQLL